MYIAKVNLSFLQSIDTEEPSCVVSSGEDAYYGTV
jgi:hypothetical protein